MDPPRSSGRVLQVVMTWPGLHAGVERWVVVVEAAGSLSLRAGWEVMVVMRRPLERVTQ
jgi:hypothetical protein